MDPLVPPGRLESRRPPPQAATRWATTRTRGLHLPHRGSRRGAPSRRARAGAPRNPAPERSASSRSCLPSQVRGAGGGLRADPGEGSRQCPATETGTSSERWRRFRSSRPINESNPYAWKGTSRSKRSGSRRITCPSSARSMRSTRPTRSVAGAAQDTSPIGFGWLSLCLRLSSEKYGASVARGIAAKALDVHGHHPNLGRRTRKQCAKDLVALARRHEREAKGSNPLAPVSLRHGQAHVREGAPVDGERRTPLDAALMGEGVKEHVRGGVGSLAGRADRGRRAIQDKMLEWQVARGLVEVPSPAPSAPRRRGAPQGSIVRSVPSRRSAAACSTPTRRGSSRSMRATSASTSARRLTSTKKTRTLAPAASMV